MAPKTRPPKSLGVDVPNRLVIVGLLLPNDHRLILASPHSRTLAQTSIAFEAGRYVLRGIHANQMYIFSHPEFRDVMAARGAALLSALPDEPINQARADSVRWLLSNKIYDEGA